jgi:hypothetical protein
MKKIFSLGLVFALVFGGFAFDTPTAAASQQGKGQTAETSHAAKVKAEVQKRGTGEGSKVIVKLRNSNTEVKGYISKIDETSFEVKDKKTGQATTIAYADAEKVRGPGLSTGTKVAIGVGIGAILAVGIVVIAAAHSL